MSKGDSPRPHDPARYRSEWERIFKQDPCDLMGLSAVFGIVLGQGGIAVWDWRDDPARGETDGETGGA